MAIHVLLVVEARIASVQLIEKVLAKLSETTSVTFSTRIDREVRGSDLTPSTVPVIVRTSTPAAARFADVLVQHGIRYCYYLDDNFWLLERDSPIGRHYARPSVRRALDGVVCRASTVITSTPALAEFVSELNDAVIHLDAGIDVDRCVPPPPRTDGRIVMGFAGSTGRGRDVDALGSVIAAALERQPRLEFEVIGPTVSLSGHERVHHFDYLETHEEYVEFQRSRAWDFALAPLRGSPAQAYKTDVKYREYATQMIPGVYQAALPYAHIRNGETGLVAESAAQWAAAIDRLAGDPQLRSHIAARAWEDVAQRYGMDVVCGRWFEALQKLEPVGAATAELQTLQQAIDAADLLNAGGARRAELLWLYGIDHVRRYGVWRTMRRTVRFLWRRIMRRT